MKTEKNDAGTDEQDNPKSRAGHLSQRRSEGLLQRVRVKSLEFQQNGAKRNDDKNHPLAFGKEPDRLQIKPILAEMPQNIGRPKSEGQQKGIHDLVQLQIKFLFATGHASDRLSGAFPHKSTLFFKCSLLLFPVLS